MKKENTKNQKDQKNTKKTVMLIAAVALLLAAAVLITLAVTGVFHKEEKKEEHKGVVGIISDDWDSGVPDSDDGSQKSGTKIPGYSSAEMNAGDDSLVLRIGNPKGNEVGFFATVKLKDGTVLYESELMKPGQGMEIIPLNKTLDKGVYEAMVVYQCVLLDDENTPLNAAESAFTLYVN